MADGTDYPAVMKFIVRKGTDPVGKADSSLLTALGLPGGGIVSVGKTHVMVSPGETTSPTALMLGALTMANARVSIGDTVDVRRAMLPPARRVVVSPIDAEIDARHLARSLQGIPVSEGDRVAVKVAYGKDTTAQPVEVQITAVTPGPYAVIGSATVVHETGEETADVVAQPAGSPSGEELTTARALLAGLETEVEVMTGWLSLLTSEGDLPEVWGLPKVAGVLLEGPAGCGKSEIVAAAAETVGTPVREVALELVFKPQKLLELLEKAVNDPARPAVIFLDRLDAVVGDDALFRNQVAAIMRWFLDAVAERPRLACVLGVSSVSRLPEAVAASAFIPRTLKIPPPDLQRRALLFQAALAKVPSGDIDYNTLAARTAGFSGADVLAAVVHASALVAQDGGVVTGELLTRAIEETTPSLGTASLGEMPSYGFERVANLEEVKQRLTESVIWQMKEPERFTRLGIEPPRGILLYGPPGTGKTFVIRALAHESGAAFFPIKGAELLDKYVGESERAVREVFARARAVAPSILFFDEIDALAPVRGNSTNSVTDSVVAALLTELDGVADRGDVFAIGATNRRDLVDPALLRPGRLETHLYLGLPEAESRRAFFAISDVPLAEDVDIEQIITNTEGMSFAEMSGLLREAALGALRRDSSALAVTRADIHAAIEHYQNR
jgi:transitional endoplasmic reticulum ATPase